MIDTPIQEKFASNITGYIISKVMGTHNDDEIINEKPHRLYLIGTLAARKPESDETKNITFDDSKTASIRASELKVSILSQKKELISKPEVIIKATGNVYYKIKNDVNSENLTDENKDKNPKKNKWKRLSFSEKFKLNLCQDSEFNLDFSKTYEKANNDVAINKKIIDGIWNVKISVKLTEFDEDNVLISFNYENTSQEPEQTDIDFERTLFNCNIEIDIGNLIIKEFIDEYNYEGYKQKYFYDFRTKNCQAIWLDDKRKQFTTEHFARFEQENIRPMESILGLDLTFANLMIEKNAIYSLEGFIDEMKKYDRIYKTNVTLCVSENEYQSREKNSNRQNTWKERNQLAEHFEKLIVRIENGLNLIKTDANVKESFLKTNESFYNYYLAQDISIPQAGWRLFQLAFFLSSIESVVKECDLDIVDVLHVDTGGGKSEAYFALIVFTSFYERCIGRKDGVSAIVKFPLRMLSIQQLERAASVIMHSEEVRKKYKELFSGDPFSLGYYVGSKDSDFPDLYAKVKANLYENKKLISPPPSSKIISKCPICPSN